MTVVEQVTRRARTRRVTPTAPSARQRWTRRLPLLPALIYMIVITQIPFIVTLWYSLENWNLTSNAKARFTGLSNYASVFTDANYRNSLVVSVIMTAVAVIVSMVLAVALALLLNQKVLGRGLARTLLITPFLIMPVASALLWKTTMLDPTYGLVNWLLSPFGVHHVAWLSSHPLGSIIVVLIWRWTPFMTLIVLAGLQGQPLDVLEAARVDGAGALVIFRRMIFPHLRPYIELGTLLGSIYIVNTFDEVYSMTQGGPGTSTTNMPYYLYEQAFQAYNIGGAAALGVITVIIVMIIATFALRLIASVFRFEEAVG
ncbi:MAG TPA: sugar ABC transporter permease [Streptosporangiaceae bacterium]|nr:sugar ABC transporter permease [Streptosporangiaceae bacterium]